MHNLSLHTLVQLMLLMTLRMNLMRTSRRLQQTQFQVLRTSSVAQELAIVLNEMESGDEVYALARAPSPSSYTHSLHPLLSLSSHLIKDRTSKQ
ncbi:hypothetical protein P8452_21306 [Trifolium repens]|nr:hypothetical protein P8452_21306 [Trifolium repens]